MADLFLSEEVESEIRHGWRAATGLGLMPEGEGDLIITIVYEIILNLELISTFANGVLRILLDYTRKEKH